MDRKELLKNIVETLDKKKATDIKSLEITDLTVVADYFVIATGTSGTHLRSLADEVEDRLSQLGVEPGHIEGKATGWILLDYGTVIVHLFTADQREHFNLEHLWADATDMDISEYISE
ncbi:MAG: ribosome silencing factor [Oscillospiraceae bacterium]|nr:ribosome silencing factor [Oscillospiraceae bacterium]